MTTVFEGRSSQLRLTLASGGRYAKRKEELSPFCTIVVSKQHARLAVPETGAHAEQGESLFQAAQSLHGKKEKNEGGRYH
ncbi:hypothetical protein BJV78DRAFT_1257727 [Lactifluus subvellereus]|nr:hypothetical protein BJV78DRAFT_1257727 [Lactifluus subvellereus]